jgi:Uri superfamily endonuclease
VKTIDGRKTSPLGHREPQVLPREPGGYVLVFRLDENVRIRPGKLGITELLPGHYLYFGSALSGLAPRLARHLRRRKKRHWHIDSLTSAIRPHEVWWIATKSRMECDWARLARADEEASIPVPGFGSSDCRCSSHLMRLESEAALTRVLMHIAAVTPGTNRLDVPARLTSRFLNSARVGAMRAPSDQAI